MAKITIDVSVKLRGWALPVLIALYYFPAPALRSWVIERAIVVEVV